jgi:hypothetical protein
MQKAVDTLGKSSTYNLIEQLQAENQILNFQINSYEAVLKFKERWKKGASLCLSFKMGKQRGGIFPKR